MRAIALALSALLILPLLAAAVEPGVLADAGQSVLQVPAQEEDSQPSAAPVGARLSGPQPFITILCKFADEDDEPKPLSFFEGLFGAAHPGLDDYWREVSYGQISLAGSRVVGWYTLPRPASAYRNEPAAMTDLDLLAGDCAAAADADVRFPDYVGVNLMFNETLDDAAWGGRKCLALDGEPRCYGMTWLWPRAFAKQYTVVHEMGHTFGLHHSFAGRGEIYSNLWDVMSASSKCEPDSTYGFLSPHIIAYDKDQLGWIPADRKYSVSPQGVTTIELGALADPASKGYLLALISIANSPGRFYTVEARLRTGYDAALPADTVLIHEIDPTRDPPAKLVNHLGDGDTRASAGMWLPGDVFVDAAGAVAVSVDGATATGFVVTIATGARPWPLSPTGAVPLPPGDITFAWQPVTGTEGYELRIEPWAPQSAAGGISRTVRAAATTLALPPGAYRWQVRARPAGEWTPPVRVVIGFAGRRWLPSEVVPASVGKIRSGLAIAAVLPRPGVSVAWADSDGMFLPVTIHVAQRDAVGWQATGQSIPDYDVRVGPIPTLALGPQGEVCGIWLEHGATLGAVRASAVRDTDTGLWFACWPQLQPQSEGGTNTATADVTKKGRPENAIRINQEDLAIPPSRPVLLLDRAGAAYAAWNGAESGVPGLFSARRPADKTWKPEHSIAEGSGPWSLWSPAIAVDDRGNLHAIWADSRDSETEIYATTQAADGRWGPGVPVSEAATGARINPTIAIDGQGSTYAAWQSFHGCANNEGTGDIEFAHRPVGGGWERSVLVSTDIGGSNVSNPVIAASPEGATYLVWEEKIEGRFALFASYQPANGDWEPKTPIPDAAGNRTPAGPALAVDADGNAYVTWLDTRTDQPVIRFAQAVK
jgi:hypothetical protein